MIYDYDGGDDGIYSSGDLLCTTQNYVILLELAPAVERDEIHVARISARLWHCYM